MNPRIYILNHATGEEIEREMTDDEVAVYIVDTPFEENNSE